VVDDIIYYKYHIYLVPESTLKEKIMEAMHNTPMVGHPEILQNLQADQGEVHLEGTQG
jgi:hypothetical protein